jgi:hypothetical protein
MKYLMLINGLLSWRTVFKTATSFSPRKALFYVSSFIRGSGI